MAEPTRMDDELLIRRAFEADPRQGFTLLFRRYYPNLCNHAVRLVYSRQVAEDLVAEVFTNFWHNRSDELITGSFRAYLYQAVRYRSYSYLKAEAGVATGDESLLGEVPAPMTSDALLYFDELQRIIEQAVATLPPQSRRAFLLSRYESKKYPEIADELGISVKAVERLISRALLHLRSHIGRHWPWMLILTTSWLA